MALFSIPKNALCSSLSGHGWCRCRLLKYPGLREVFYKAEGDRWRAPNLNETCCARPALADLLDHVSVVGPDAMYEQVP